MLVTPQTDQDVHNLKDEIKKEVSDVGIDEWTYLDNFFKRFNKACRVAGCGTVLRCSFVVHELLVKHISGSTPAQILRMQVNVLQDQAINCQKVVEAGRIRPHVG